MMSRLWYRQPAGFWEWEEALPVGNGRLGGMVFGRTDYERIQLNEESIWYGKPLNRNNPDALGNLEKIRELVENIYTNEYLNRITVNWNNELADADGETGLTLQRDFFARHINYSKDRVVVIISDALRYEVAHTLFEKMQTDEKCNASIGAMQGVLPSYTP